MGVVSSFLNSYSSKIKIGVLIISLLLLVGGWFYIKSLRSDVEKVTAQNIHLTTELENSEAEKMLLLKKVSESSLKITELGVLVSSHSKDAEKSKRNLERFRIKYKNLVDQDPSAAAEAVLDGYNEFVSQLSCATGGGVCD